MKNETYSLDKTEKTNVFDDFLNELSLPTENVLSKISEREIVYSNIPTIVNSLSIDSKKNAIYLSRFAAAAYVGLFDAALNYVWDEVVLSLRKMIVDYGVDYFFDISVPTERRSNFKSKEDLIRIQDSTLLKTCFEMSIIDSILLKELNHILDMRNFISAAHPNTDSITGYQLLGYLDTSVKKVIELKFSDSVVQVQSIISKVKNENYQFSTLIESQLTEICNNLSIRSSNTLLQTMFGIYVDQSSTQLTREKSIKIAKAIWNNVDTQYKYELGIKYDGFVLNMDTAKEALAEIFLENLDGLGYLSKNTISQKLSIYSNNLDSAHRNWDNYYNEVPIIREINNLLKVTKNIPSDRFSVLTKVITECRIGNGNSGGISGVSPNGLEFYNEYFSYFTNDQIVQFFDLLIRENLLVTYSILKEKNFRLLFTNLMSNSISERVKEILNYLVDYPKRYYSLNEDFEFRRLLNNLIAKDLIDNFFNI